MRLADNSGEFENRMPFVAPNQRPSEYNCGTLTVGEGLLLNKFGKLELGEWYLRAGRTSTHAGVCNGVVACCNWDGDDKNRYDRKGDLVRIGKGTTEEYLLLNKRRGAANETVQCEFGLPGDSGSWLINKQGKVCGLYYANSTNWVGPDGVEVWHCNGGLVMSMPDVCRGVEWKTAEVDAGGYPTRPSAILGLPDA